MRLARFSYPFSSRQKPGTSRFRFDFEYRNGTERGGQIATDRAGEPEKKVPGETVSQTAEKTTAAVSHGGSVAGVCIPTYKVWNHRLYGYAGDNLALTDSDLGPLHREK